MTTGRINQVAILGSRRPQRGGRRGGPPGGGRPEFATRKGREPPRQATERFEQLRQSRAHPIAPTEFSKGRSAAGGNRAVGLHTPQHARLRRRVPSPVRALGQRTVRAFPQGSSGAVAIGQPSTDPACCLLAPGGSRASVPDQQSAAEPPGWTWVPWS
jgi:hypothetical protein